MNRRTAPLVLSCFLALVGCGGDETTPQRPAPVEPAEPTTHDECLTHCEFLQGCGATPASEDCASLCKGLAEVPTYATPCRSCMADQCGKIAECLSDGAVCGEPNVSVSATLHGLTGESEAHVALALWDGTPTGFVASKGPTAPGTTVLTLGHAAKAGVSYQIQYYIDSNEDGVCEPGVDITGVGPLYIDGPASLVYWLGGNAEEVNTCDVFPSKDALCQERCAEAARCEAASVDCTQACAEAPTRVARACMDCQSSRSCDEQATACYQAGGACEASYTPPTVQLLLRQDGSFYEPGDVGKLVYARVRNAAGRVLGEAPPVASQEGGFVINFGDDVLWESQTYAATFYLDRNEDGVCNGDDPALGAVIEVGTNVTLVYALLDQDSIAPSSCEQYNAP